MIDHTPIQPKTKEIPLTQGRVAIVDAADYEWLSQWAWRLDTGYAVRKESVDGKWVKFYMHRVLTGAPKGKEVDHINGNELDNRRANLRICTHAENLRNRGLPSNSTSGYKGAYWHKKAGRWYSKIKIGEDNIYLGLFDTAEEAARAYDAATLELYGEFSRSNFADDFKEFSDFWPSLADEADGRDIFEDVYPVTGEEPQ